jgi:phospholipase C
MMSWTGFNWDGHEYPRFLVDVTGDGRADIVGCGLDGVWLAPGDGQGAFLAPRLVLGNLAYNQGWRADRHPRYAVALRRPTQPPAALARSAPAAARLPVGGLPLPLRRAPTDLAGFGDAGVWAALNNGDGTFAPLRQVLSNLGYNQGWRVEKHPRLFADLTGDGSADIVGFGDAGVWTAINNGSGAFAQERLVLGNLGYNQGWRVEKHARYLADLTGDGRADIVGFGDAGVWTARGKGDGTFADAQFAIADLGYNQGWRIERHARFVVDLNHDGRADIVAFGDDGVWTALNKGDGSFAAPKLVLANFGFKQGWQTDRHPRFLADLTGDGRPDIVGFGDAGVWIARNNGDGSFGEAQFVVSDLGYNQGWRVDQHPRFVADLTGESRADIIGFGDAGVWTARNKGDGSFAPAQFVMADFGLHSVTDGIQHVFVLIMENRSFDHMLGFSAITGTDAVTGQPTATDGLQGTETNSFEGTTFTVQRGADNVMPAGPGHEFHDTLVQLAGAGATYPRGGPYPAVHNSGFVASYADNGGRPNLGEIMKCFTPDQLPVLNQLAKEFAVCDRWFCSLPGPTWPNRFFAHAASSGYLDDSPSSADIAWWELAPGEGFEFGNGTIFDALDKAHLEYRIYAGDDFPVASGLSGISITSIRDFSEHFAEDLGSDDFASVRYVHIEPSYDVFNDYRDGSSQHPLADVTRGEAFIKAVYEAIRNSPVWNNSVLIITWDEHGGFFDHVAPPAAQPPNDKKPEDDHNVNGFVFDKYGVRVPALVISPRIPKNLVDHRIYDHASIPATIERLFGLKPLTDRDAVANAPTTLLTLPTPRTDAPATVGVAARLASLTVAAPMAAPRHPEASVDEGQVAAFLSSAVSQDLKMSAPEQRPAIIARAKSIRTHADALGYMKDVQQRARARRDAAHMTGTTGVVRPTEPRPPLR